MVKIYSQLVGVHGACLVWEIREQVQNRMAPIRDV